MNGLLLISYLVIWAILGYLLDLSWIEIFGLAITAAITGVLAFLFGVQVTRDPDIVVDHSDDAVHKASLALLRMEELHSICPYCHGPLSRHSDNCLLKVARDSLVKLR